MRIVRVQYDGLRLVVDNVAVRGFRLPNRVRSGLEAAYRNLSVAVRRERPVTADRARVAADGFSVRGSDFELRAGKSLARRAVNLPHDDTAFQSVVKRHALGFSGADSDGLRRPVEDILVRRGDFRRRHGRAGNEILHDNPSVAVGRKLAVGGADFRAVAVRQKERRARNRGRCSLDVFRYGKRLQARIREGQRLRVLRIHNDRLNIVRRVNRVSLNRRGFRYGYHSGYIIDDDFAAAVRHVASGAGSMAAVVVHGASVRVSDMELRAGKRKPRVGGEFPYNKATLALIPECQFLRHSGQNFNALRRSVQNITLRGVRFAYRYRKSGVKSGNHDVAVAVGIINSVGRSDNLASGIRYLKLRADERLVSRS